MIPTAQDVSTLEHTPLIGNGRAAVRAACTDLAGRSELTADANVTDRLIALGAKLAFYEQAFDAEDQLAVAGQLPGLSTRAAVELHLLRARALHLRDEPEAAVQIVREQRDLARRSGAGAYWRLAAAVTGLGDTRAHLESALTGLPPAADHDRLEAHLRLADIAHRGAEPVRATAHLTSALVLADKHGDTVAAAHAAARLGHLYLELGQHSDAEPMLARAMQLARDLDDDLAVTSESSLLAALQLNRDDLEAAWETAGAEAEAGSRRRNWFAVADAANTRAHCLERVDRRTDAVHLLLATAGVLRRQGATPATNVLKARLAELRLQWTPNVFDGHFQQALTALRAGLPPEGELDLTLD